jgi:SAM-dependent methyltransferase
MPKKLSDDAFRRYDESPDAYFYQTPRLVTHIDASAILAVTEIYRETFPSGGAILDLMSSWVSHLPEEMTFSRVTGLGMNRQELAANPRLTEYVVQDLNQNTTLPFPDATFDAGGCCVSIDYLIRPIETLTEVARLMKPNAPFIITFSNRCFPTKAIDVWLNTTDQQHLDLVEFFFIESGQWTSIEKLNRSPRTGDPLYAVIARRVA